MHNSYSDGSTPCLSCVSGQCNKFVSLLSETILLLMTIDLENRCDPIMGNCANCSFGFRPSGFGLSCTPCLVGQEYNSPPGQVCVPCTLGGNCTTCSIVGDVCTQCPWGKFVDGSGCTPCPTNTYSHGGSIFSCSCEFLPRDFSFSSHMGFSILDSMHRRKLQFVFPARRLLELFIRLRATGHRHVMPRLLALDAIQLASRQQLSSLRGPLQQLLDDRPMPQLPWEDVHQREQVRELLTWRGVHCV